VKDSIASRGSDVRIIGVELYFLPVNTRAPLKFGGEVLTTVTCARARVIVTDRQGRQSNGWGETPLSVAWAWPGDVPYSVRHSTMLEFCRQVGASWATADACGHALEVGHAMLERLPALRDQFNRSRRPEEQLPHLAALVCSSPFDIALHDAYGRSTSLPVYETYGQEHLSSDLARYIGDASAPQVDFRGKYPADYLSPQPVAILPVWHLVGGLDPLTQDDAAAYSAAPQDGYPHLLDEWIRRDGLKCLKIKLRGNDAEWDYERIVRVGRIGGQYGATHLTTDFNCTVDDPQYVHSILDRLEKSEPDVFESILYVEQPFPYDLDANPIDVRDLAARKPLLMDESADSWKQVRRGRELGWNGVALKTCKTQTGALLSLCWAKAHDMHVMVQDLTNPMLAQIPHVLLAAHANTMMGVESNAMQFYPAASDPEAVIHPGVYQRRQGMLDLSSLKGPGFGYRLSEIQRELPPSAAQFANVSIDAEAGLPDAS
jgi:L-alanine-DL-glutamate epimerase-like enolase superfamily enzyme